METIYKYASADTDVTLQLYHIFDKKVKSSPKWIKFCYEFFPQLCDTLAYMQHTGFEMDMDKMEKYREHKKSVVDWSRFFRKFAALKTNSCD